MPQSQAFIPVRITRDSVHAGDDGDAPHEIVMEVQVDATIQSVLAAVVERRYLASISGGEATWIVEGQKPLAVIAQQWTEPQWLISPATLLSEIFGDEDLLALHFVYWCQASPETVIECLRNGNPLPDKYSRA